MSHAPPPLPPPLPQDNNPTKWFSSIAVLIGMLLAIMLIVSIAMSERRDAGSASVGDNPIEVDLSNANSQKIVSGAPPSGTSASQDASQPNSQQDSKEARDSDRALSPPDASSSKGVQDNKPPTETVAKETVKEKPRRAITLDSYTPSPIVSPGRKGGSGSSTVVSSLEGAGNPFIGDGNWKNTVFVIDRSGSMASWNKFPRVVRALTLAIDALKSDQSFTVILFDNSAQPYDDPSKLLKANSTNKRAVSDWLNQSTIGGGTDPTVATQMAISLAPERILLLSDGEFDPLMVDMITQANQGMPKPPRIDCVGLVEQIETLQQLAMQNDGIYYQAQ